MSSRATATSAPTPGEGGPPHDATKERTKNRSKERPKNRNLLDLPQFETGRRGPNGPETSIPTIDSPAAGSGLSSETAIEPVPAPKPAKVSKKRRTKTVLPRLHEEGGREHDERRAAQVAQQIQADAVWLAAVKKAEFKGPLWTTGAELLIAGAAETTKARIRSNGIFIDSAAMGRPVAASAYGRDKLIRCPADLDSLTWAITEKAWDRFSSEALAGGGWKPHRGATLESYFRGTCTQEFANAYTAWFTAYLKRSDALTDPITLSELLSQEGSLSLGHRAPPFMIDDDARAVLDRLTLIEQQAAVLGALGYTQVEAAHILETTPAAVWKRLARARTKLTPYYPEWSSR